MIRIENVDVFGFEGALRGMRNPLDSWGMADTEFDTDGSVKKLGEKDKGLMVRLNQAGTSHSKYLRMIHVQMDITAPLYWWKDYDTYKVGTVANSCSTMHKIHAYPFSRDMFACEDLDQIGLNVLDVTIDYLNWHREIFLKSDKKDKEAWRRMIQILPSAFLQKRTVDVSYEMILNMLGDRSHHKLSEFRQLCTTLRYVLPYMDELYCSRYNIKKEEVEDGCNNNTGDDKGSDKVS